MRSISSGVIASGAGPSISCVWISSSAFGNPISSGNSRSAIAFSPTTAPSSDSPTSAPCKAFPGTSGETSSGLATGSSMISNRSITSPSSWGLTDLPPSAMDCNSSISSSASLVPSAGSDISNPSTNSRIGSFCRGFVMVPSALTCCFSSSISSSKGPPKSTKGTLFRSGSPLNTWQSSFPFLSGMVTSAITSAGLNNFIFRRASSPFSEKIRS